MTVCDFEGVLGYEACVCGLFVVGGEACGVFGDEDVGAYASASVYGTTEVDGLLDGTVLVYGVFAEELAALVAHEQFVFVVFAVAFLIWLLDAAA